MQHWANIALDAGFAVVTPDSNGPRDYVRETALETICKGKALLGQERSGDIAAALSIIEDDNRFDTDRMVVAGWSHGAWSLMDYFTMDASAGKRPSIIKGAFFEADVKNAILFYPHCGIGALSRFREWRVNPKTLVFVAGKDTIVDGPACKTLFERKQKKGGDVDLVYYQDVDHTFDDPTLIGGPYEDFYSAYESQDAINRYRDYLKTVLGS